MLVHESEKTKDEEKVKETNFIIAEELREIKTNPKLVITSTTNKKCGDPQNKKNLSETQRISKKRVSISTPPKNCLFFTKC